MSDVTTTKLYWDDPFATSFDAQARTAQWEGRPSIVLDRTLFYPEGGGQNSDTGRLFLQELDGSGETELPIADVQVDDAGTIHHLIGVSVSADAAPILAALASPRPVRGEIDAERRRDHMAQHTAQHMLSRALLDVAHAGTV